MEGVSRDSTECIQSNALQSTEGINFIINLMLIYMLDNHNHAAGICPAATCTYDTSLEIQLYQFLVIMILHLLLSIQLYQFLVIMILHLLLSIQLYQFLVIMILHLLLSIQLYQFLVITILHLLLSIQFLVSTCKIQLNYFDGIL